MQFIDGHWVEGKGERLVSISPVDGTSVWEGNEADESQVDQAFAAASKALDGWAAMGLEDRIAIFDTFAQLVRDEKDSLGEVICREVGKPLKESIGEAGAVASKLDLTREALETRRANETHTLGPRTGRIDYRPLGVVSVFGPFNFPMHIANGQILPALLCGNTVVFKPSELTPWSAERMVQLWERAGLPPGVLNLVQGGIGPGQSVLRQRDLRGLFFTGSRNTGIKLREILAPRLEVLLALELGGNNPLVIHDPDSIDQAVETTIQSAFISSGQRCTCVRRLIVTEPCDAFLAALASKTREVRVGHPINEDVMMGPLVHDHAAAQVLAEQDRLLAAGGTSIVTSQQHEGGPAYVTPGVIDVTNCDAVTDDELFGPLLQVTRVADLDQAIAVAGDTEFGLSAGIVCQHRQDFERFSANVSAGLINWNLPTTGASGRLPFGGLGHSGNHRPAGFFTVDFCNQAIAELEPQTEVDKA
ncbi:MAG: succinylglutamate-semialdehyde dehydrogenase [Planctomycetota bacterium]